MNATPCRTPAIMMKIWHNNPIPQETRILIDPMKSDATSVTKSDNAKHSQPDTEGRVRPRNMLMK